MINSNTPTFVVSSSSLDMDCVIPLFLASMTFFTLYYLISIIKEHVIHACFMEKCKLGKNTIVEFSTELRQWYHVSSQKNSNKNTSIGTYAVKMAYWLVNRPFVIAAVGGFIYNFYTEFIKRRESEKTREDALKNLS